MKPKYNILLFILGILILGTFSSCEKETEVYEVQEFHISEEGTSKSAQKTSVELISIAFFDLFGEEIPADLLNGYMVAFESFGDKSVMTERIILNFLSFTEVLLPTQAQVKADPSAFVVDTYKKFYSRLPSEFEKAFFVNYLKENPEVSSKQIYQAFLTSDEYLYY